MMMNPLELFYLRIVFHFDFFQDDQTPALATISEGQWLDNVNGLLCQTQRFLSGLLQNHTNETHLHVETIDIDWMINDDEDDDYDNITPTKLDNSSSTTYAYPVTLSFTAQINDARLAPWPLNDFYHEHILLEELDLLQQREKQQQQQQQEQQRSSMEGLRLQHFIHDYIWQSSSTSSTSSTTTETNYFSHVRQMAFDAEITPLNPHDYFEYVLEKVNCPPAEKTSSVVAPTTITPTIPSGRSGDGSSSTGDDDDILMSDLPSSASPPPAVNIKPPPPADEEEKASPTNNGTTITTTDINTNNTTTITPTTRFRMRFGFFNDTPTEQQVTQHDINGVLCQIQAFFTRLIRTATDRWTLVAKPIEIDWGIIVKDEDPTTTNFPAVHINFTIQLIDNVMPVSRRHQEDKDEVIVDDQVFIDRMNGLGDVGLKQFITNWIWKSEPLHTNYFVHVNTITYNADLLPHPVKGAMIPEVKCADCYSRK